jgi:DNA polymerase-1
MLFLDIETDTRDGSLVCVGWAVDDEPVESSPTLPDSVRRMLADVDEVVVTHSGYDVRYLHLHEGADVNTEMHDTQVMAWLANENTPLDLHECALRYLGQNLDKTLQKQAGIAPYADVAAYCEKDVAVTRELYYKLRTRLKQDGLWDYFQHTEAPFTKTLRDMEFRGLPVDVQGSARLEAVMRKQMDKLEAELTVGLPTCFNIRSPAQVSLFLGSSEFTLKDRQPVGDYELEKTLMELAGVNIDPSNAPPGTFLADKIGRVWAHGEWVLAGRGHGFNRTVQGGVARPQLMDNPKLAQDPWVQKYLEFKKLDKLIGTYLTVFQERGAADGRIYGRFNQTGTTTGRLSSSEPNLQNIPSRGAEGEVIRRLFPGDLVVGDFSQLEPRLMAHFSQDPGMMAAFKQGRDLYDEIASRVGCARGVAKTLVLAMSYGAGPDKVASTLRLNGYSTVTGAEARRLLNGLKQEFQVYFNWREWVIASSKNRGYVETIDGRRRRLDMSMGNAGLWKDPAAPGRQAANAVVQGSAADIVRRVMLHTTRRFPDLRLLAQVHDELVWEYDPAQGTPDLAALEKWVLQIAERGLSVPLVFEPHMGDNWYTAKEGKP